MEHVREAVTNGIDGLFAAFHRTKPRDDVYAHLGGVAEDLGMSVEAVSAAFAEMRTRARLPENLELELREAWRKWCEAGGYSFSDGFVCPDCGGTGWIVAWRSDAKPGDGPTAVPCACGAAGEMLEGLTGGVRSWTVRDLAVAGWTFGWTPPEGARAVDRASVRRTLDGASRQAPGAPQAPAPASEAEYKHYEFDFDIPADAFGPTSL